MNPLKQRLAETTRRFFFQQSASGLGAVALTALLNERLFAAADAAAKSAARPLNPLAPKPPHFPPKARHVISLHMAGAPPHLDLFDHKPLLQKLNGQPCPESLYKKERFAFIKGVPKMLGTPHQFAKHGQSGIELCNLLPNLATVADELCVIRSLYTDQFNHSPGQIMLYTGAPRQGRPGMGAWVTYGLGSESQDLPGFVTLVSGGKTPDGGASLWGSGFLPTVYQGVQCRSQGEPVLYVTDPPGMSREVRRRSLDALRDLNEAQLAEVGDPEIATRIAQYELAFRMQASVPEAMDITRETPRTLAAYGAKPGQVAFANNCLLARRLVERGVRFVQLFDWGWDMHGTGQDTDLITALPKKCRETDQPIAALIKDLRQRGLLDETLIVWCGEFGRTPMNEERNGSKLLGRDHHPHAFSVWMAGGGVKGGLTYGATDEFGYHAAENRVHVHDLQATILHLLGLDHTKLTFKFQGRDYRLTDVFGKVVKDIVA